MRASGFVSSGDRLGLSGVSGLLNLTLALDGILH
jgi:hypothetical protein